MRKGNRDARTVVVAESYGGMSERFNELFCKKSETAMCRGFESHSLRQNAQSASGFYRLQAFSFSPLWKDFSVSSLRDLNSGYVVGVSLCEAIRRRSYEITSNAPLRPFTIASADDSLEL